NGSGFSKVGRSDLHYDMATMVFGTPGFMSPEQELDGTVSETSDIYSLGMTLAKIFCPFAHRDDSWSDAREGKRRDREKSLVQLLVTMTAPNARDRPRRVQDVLDALAVV